MTETPRPPVSGGPLTGSEASASEAQTTSAPPDNAPHTEPAPPGDAPPPETVPPADSQIQFAPPGGAPMHPTPGQVQEQIADRPEGWSVGMPSASRSAAAPRGRSRVRWIVGGVLLGLVLLLAGIFFLVTRSQPGRIHLPDTLLGQRQITGPLDQALANRIQSAVQAQSHGKFSDVTAAIYGNSARGFVVVVGIPCGNCYVEPAGKFLNAMRAHGASDAALFPPGAHGGTLLCYSRPTQLPIILCQWNDALTTGQVRFVGTASSLADAAAKTRQIRASVEH